MRQPSGKTVKGDTIASPDNVEDDKHDVGENEVEDDGVIEC